MLAGCQQIDNPINPDDITSAPDVAAGEEADNMDSSEPAYFVSASPATGEKLSPGQPIILKFSNTPEMFGMGNTFSTYDRLYNKTSFKLTVSGTVQYLPRGQEGRSTHVSIIYSTIFTQNRNIATIYLIPEFFHGHVPYYVELGAEPDDIKITTGRFSETARLYFEWRHGKYFVEYNTENFSDAISQAIMEHYPSLLEARD